MVPYLKIEWKFKILLLLIFYVKATLAYFKVWKLMFNWIIWHWIEKFAKLLAHGMKMQGFFCHRFYVKSILAGLDSKNAILTISEASEISFLVNRSSENMQKLTNTKIQRCWNCQSFRFRDFKLTKLDFTKNLSGRKITKILHCGTLTYLKDMKKKFKHLQVS